MFADGSADLIYCCHAFEYFDRIEAEAVLAEYVRVLKPGGTLRLAVPDFAALAAVYRQTADLDRIVGPLFGRMAVVDRGGTAQTIYHRTVYDRASLERLLAKAGFDNICVWDWRQTEHAAVDDFSQAYYPHMDKNDGLLISLNLQGDKAK